MIRSLLYLLFSFCLCCSTGFSQTPEVFMSNMMKQDFPSAINSFTAIENKKDLKSSIHYYAAISYAVSADSENALEQLEQAAKKGFTTKAGLKNPVFNNLSNDEQLKKIESQIEINAKSARREFEKIKKQYSYHFDTTDLPKEVQLGPSMSQPKAQGNRNTCSAFAATALAESVIQKKLNKELDLSEQYAYYIAKTNTLNNEFLYNGYGQIDGLCGYLALEGYAYGSALEKYWPYEIEGNWKTLNDERCKEIEGRPSVTCFTGLPPKTLRDEGIRLNSIFIPFEEVDKFILKEKRPVLVNIWLYVHGTDKVTGKLTIPPQNYRQKLGGHVILLTGYNTETEEFTFRNSWGPMWGNNGYGTLSKKYLLEHYETVESVPFALDASQDEKEYLAKVSMGASAFVSNKGS